MGADLATSGATGAVTTAGAGVIGSTLATGAELQAARTALTVATSRNDLIGRFTDVSKIWRFYFALHRILPCDSALLYLHKCILGEMYTTKLQHSCLPVYRDFKDGAELTYKTSDAKMVGALHKWLGAQLSDHGKDAMEGDIHHEGMKTQ